MTRFFRDNSPALTALDPVDKQPRLSGIELIDSGKCPIKRTTPLACMVCPFGHMLDCHYPQTCNEAKCSHYRVEVPPDSMEV